MVSGGPDEVDELDLGMSDAGFGPEGGAVLVQVWPVDVVVAMVWRGPDGWSSSAA